MAVQVVLKVYIEMAQLHLAIIREEMLETNGECPAGFEIGDWSDDSGECCCDPSNQPIEEPEDVRSQLRFHLEDMVMVKNQSRSSLEAMVMVRSQLRLSLEAMVMVKSQLRFHSGTEKSQLRSADTAEGKNQS